MEKISQRRDLEGRKESGRGEHRAESGDTESADRGYRQLVDQGQGGRSVLVDGRWLSERSANLECMNP